MEKLTPKLLYKGPHKDYYEYEVEKIGEKVNEIVEFINRLKDTIKIDD